MQFLENDMTNLIGSKQLAQQLGISLRTLDSMDKSGNLPKSLRIGHLRRWRAGDVESWIDSKLTDSQIEGPLVCDAERSRLSAASKSQTDF